MKISRRKRYENTKIYWDKQLELSNESSSGIKENKICSWNEKVRMKNLNQHVLEENIAEKKRGGKLMLSGSVKIQHYFSWANVNVYWLGVRVWVILKKVGINLDVSRMVGSKIKVRSF